MVKRTCIECHKEFETKCTNAIYCSKECKKTYTKRRAKEEWQLAKDKKVYTCQVCNKEYVRDEHHKSYNFCSKTCGREFARRKVWNARNQRRQKKFEGGILGYDYVECPICHTKFTQIARAHLRDHHNLTVDEFRKLYPDNPITCKKFIENNLDGQNNPCSKRNSSDEEIRNRSPYCLEFWLKRGKTEQDYINFIEKEKSKAKYREKSMTVEYYLKRGYSEEEAKEIIHTKCVSNGLAYYIKKYGEEVGLKKYKERILKWANKIFTGHTHSKVSDEMISSILENENINPEDFKFGDNEFRVYIPEIKKFYLLDLCNIKEKKAIEFNGDYWHCNPMIYEEDYYNRNKRKYAKEIWNYDDKKRKFLEKEGYQIMVIWESDYRTNKDLTVKKAKEFLFGTNEKTN